MKIVIPARGTNLDSEVDPRFGRARTLVVYDTEAKSVEAVDNSVSADAVQGAGIQVAENISRLGADCAIACNCGPKAFRVLQAAGIKVFLCPEGTVRGAVEGFEAGKLEEANSPNVGGHWT